MVYGPDDPKFKFVPDTDDFVKALQDPGQRNMKTEDKLMVYKDLEKFCGKLASKWKKLKFPGFPANQTHGKKVILKTLIQQRKTFDSVDVLESLKKHADKDHKIFLLVNETDGGFFKIIPIIQSFWERNSVKAQANRVPEDAIRLASIMVLQEHRAAIAEIQGRAYRVISVRLRASRQDRAR